MMIEKKCKDCGTTENLFTFKRKNDSVPCVCNICKVCYSKKTSIAHIGQIISEETKQKLRLANLGKKQSQETINKRIEKLKRPCREETKQKIRLANLGYNHSDEAKQKMRIYHTGLKQSQETIQKRVNKLIGITHPPRTDEFRQNMSKIVKVIMNTPERKKLCVENMHNCMLYHFQDTSIEIKVKELLDKNKINYKHPYLVTNIKNQYMADFYLPDQNIIIEADGEYWHNKPEMQEKDKIRTQQMLEKGYNVLRFFGFTINKHLDFVEQKILSYC